MHVYIINWRVVHRQYLCNCLLSTHNLLVGWNKCPIAQIGTWEDSGVGLRCYSDIYLSGQVVSRPSSEPEDSRLHERSHNARNKFILCVYTLCGWGHTVAQLVEALRYKPEGREFYSRWCHWSFSLTQSFRPHYGPGFNSDSNKMSISNIFVGGKGGPCIGLTTLPPPSADCLEIWDPHLPGTLRACPDL